MDQPESMNFVGVRVNALTLLLYKLVCVQYRLEGVSQMFWILTSVVPVMLSCGSCWCFAVLRCRIVELCFGACSFSIYTGDKQMCYCTSSICRRWSQEKSSLLWITFSVFRNFQSWRRGQNWWWVESYLEMLVIIVVRITILALVSFFKMFLLIWIFFHDILSVVQTIKVTKQPFRCLNKRMWHLLAPTFQTFHRFSWDHFQVVGVWISNRPLSEEWPP